MKDILIKPFTIERLFSTLSVSTRQNRVLHWKAIRSLWNVSRFPQTQGLVAYLSRSIFRVNRLLSFPSI